MRVRKSATGSVRFIVVLSFPVRSELLAATGRTSGNGCGADRSRRYLWCRAAMLQPPGRLRWRTYQLDFTTPGISPLSARPRKHKRQMPNFRRNARGRPQSWHRLCWRDLNFGLRATLTRFAVVAMNLLFLVCPETDRYAPWRKGIPKKRRRVRAPLSSLAVVTI